MKISFRFSNVLSSNATRHHRRRSLVLACALIAALPLAWRGTSCGHDFDFHLQSWLEVIRHWREGMLYPHWDSSANYTAGEPRFVFYPPASWLIGALLGLLMPWSWTPVAFTLLALIASGTSFYAMAREWIAEDAAAVAACVYVLNPYLLFVAYERAAYGELLSAIWLPLLVLFGLRQKPGLVPLSLIIAALWLTNAPSAVMGCYLLALLVLVAVITEHRYLLAARATGGVAMGLGLAAFYIVPAAYQQRWVEITRAIGPGMRVEDSFLFGHTGEAFHDHVLYKASWIAVVMLATAIIATILSWRNKDRSPLRAPFLTSLAVIAFLLLPFSDFFWQHAPELKFLQFPWRWLLVLGMVMAVLIGFALRGSFQKADTRRHILIRSIAMLALAAVMASIAAHSFWQPCDDEDNIAAQRDTFHENGFEGTDEYTAHDADNSEIQQDLPQVRVTASVDADEADSSIAENPEWTPKPADARIQVDRWQSERRDLTIDTPRAGFAVLTLMDYPAWRVTVNGKPLPSRPHRDDGLMTIPLAAGHSSISIRYGMTEDAEAGLALTLLACGVLIALALYRKKQRT